MGSAWLIFRFGSRLHLMDVPNERSSHERPVPRGGGIGIPIAAGMAACLFARQGLLPIGLGMILAGGALFNDLRELPVRVRFALQVTAASVLLLLGGRDLLPGIVRSGGWPAATIAAGVLVVYVVAATNFFNFMDGINGIAGFEALVSFLFLGIYIGISRGPLGTAIVCFSIAAAAAGFLMLNFPRARVFMGDVGSIFLGFVFSALTVVLADHPWDLVRLSLFQSVFFIDSGLTIFLRVLRRENILSAHRSHLYQELVHRRGWSQFRVTLSFAVAQALAGLPVLIGSPSPAFLVAYWAGLVVVYGCARSALRLH